MNKLIQVIPMLLAVSCARRPQTAADVESNYKVDDLGVHIENTEDSSENRYSIDNQIYKIGRKFIFDYSIVRQGDTLKITAPEFTSPGTDAERQWSFIATSTPNENKLENISITVLPGIINSDQTELKYQFQYPGKVDCKFYSTSGVIENGANTWMHPPRDKYFMILELNPFPYIRQPFIVGNKWAWSLRIGEHWGDDRWRTWTGTIQNDYQYKIVGRQNLTLPIGELECWVVQATASSSVGSTALTAYYNEDFGFVKLDYTNIDHSKVMLQVTKIE